MTSHPTAAAVSAFVAGLRATTLPADVIAMARQSLIDWFAVCIAANTDPEARRVADTVHAWGSQGGAVAVDGRTGSPAPIALVNGTFSHALDYDDFHIDSVHHAGGPTFAAALALAMHRNLGGDAVLAAFVAGFEISTRLGMNNTGLALGNAGWHPTCILGHLSSSMACGYLMQLDRPALEQALCFAAGQASGMMSSAGTIAKPFLVGKAAFDGVVAAELAERGAAVPGHLMEEEAGLFSVLFQKRVNIDLGGLGKEWQVLRNTFKPYSACQLTHASIDAAQRLAGRIDPAAIKSVRSFVHPFALKIAGQEEPRTTLGARFSLKHCIAMGLVGRGADPADFSEACLRDRDVVRVRERIEIVPTDAQERTSSRMEVTTDDGRRETVDIAAALGSLGRPMSLADTERKFLAATTPALGSDAERLLALLKRFEAKGVLAEVAAMLRGIANDRPVRTVSAESASR